MYKDDLTVTINPVINQQLLEHAGFPASEGQALVTAITALDTRYRLEPFDVRYALRLLQGGMALSTIAATLRPL